MWNVAILKCYVVKNIVKFYMIDGSWRVGVEI
jgi:hypothetical protein